MSILRDNPDNAIYIGYSINKTFCVNDIKDNIVYIRQKDNTWRFPHTLELHTNKELSKLKQLKKAGGYDAFDFGDNNIEIPFKSHIGLDCGNIHIKTYRSLILTIDHIVMTTYKNLTVDCDTFIINNQHKEIVTKINNVNINADLYISDKSPGKIIWGNSHIRANKVLFNNITSKEVFSEFIKNLSNTNKPDLSILGDSVVNDPICILIRSSKTFGIAVYNDADYYWHITDDYFSSDPIRITDKWVQQGIIYAGGIESINKEFRPTIKTW